MKFTVCLDILTHYVFNIVVPEQCKDGTTYLLNVVYDWMLYSVSAISVSCQNGSSYTKLNYVSTTSQLLFKNLIPHHYPQHLRQIFLSQF